MKLLKQFLIILAISFVGEILKYLPAIACSGEHIWHGYTFHRSADRPDTA